jgi:di/tricarboxylate transporter
VTPAVASLIALLIAIVLSCTSRINVGLLAIGFAWLIGVYMAGWKVDAIAAGFPAALFLTLSGVTLLFALAESNGTLERLAHRAVSLASGNARLIPIIFFVIASVVSAAGPGSISTVALVAPLAIAIGKRAGVSSFLTSLMVANGANAGNMSPVSAVGIIANTKMAEGGLTGHELNVWLANFLVHVAVGAGAYFAFGGLRLRTSPTVDAVGIATIQPTPALDGRERLTVFVIVGWIVGVVAFGLNIGMAAFCAAAILILVRAADETAAVKRVPWGVILMVSGVSVLIAVLEKTGGMDLFTSLLARLASPASVNGVIAFVMGLISSYSSTSGVVLPAFLPTVPGIVEKIGGGDPLAVALSINVGAALVDVSPLSTLGALCIAAVSDPDESRDLFGSS